MSVINTNTAANISANAIKSNEREMTRAMERLSTGSNQLSEGRRSRFGDFRSYVRANKRDRASRSKRKRCDFTPPDRRRRHDRDQ